MLIGERFFVYQYSLYYLYHEQSYKKSQTVQMWNMYEHTPLSRTLIEKLKIRSDFYKSLNFIKP
jgi:hypothetical protein